MKPQSDDPLSAVWIEHRPAMLERVSLIERALAALTAGELQEPLRGDAQAAAHTLVGSVGTFGFALASQTARKLELELAAPTRAQARSISVLTAALRHELQNDEGASPPTHPDAQRTHVLLVSADRDFCMQIVAESSARELECSTVATAEQARAACAEQTPAIVLLDLTFPPPEMAEVHELLSELTSGSAPLPVLVLAGSDAFTDRIEAARRGGRGFLAKSLSAAEILDAAVQFVARDELRATRVLVVDDDPAMLDGLRVLLERHEIEVSTLADTARFWETLEEVAPELLLLDVDMPGVNGPELCRVVRSDVRWSQIAVIFVSAHTDQETVEAVFRAGADDYLAKPIVETELMTRVANRLDRVRLRRMQAETDSLTGLSNRAKSSEGMTQLLSLARRFSQPVSIAMLDLDRFKRVNDTYGHAAGDRVLRSLSEHLRQDFRGDDVIGRWGGEEFVVGMYGMTRQDGVRRLTDTLHRISQKELAAGPERFRVSFSAGVAQYPHDGDNPDALIDAADQALYRAKAAGRAQVLGAGRTQMLGAGRTQGSPAKGQTSGLRDSNRPDEGRL
jgi:diguanylate cyclase (GGDEF)-like protein